MALRFVFPTSDAHFLLVQCPMSFSVRSPSPTKRPTRKNPPKKLHARTNLPFGNKFRSNSAPVTELKEELLHLQSRIQADKKFNLEFYKREFGRLFGHMSSYIWRKS